MNTLFELLFGNPGKKFKVLAMAFFYLILICGIMTIFMLIISGRFSADSGYYVLLTIIATPVCAFIIPLPLYAIGTLIESVERKEELMHYMLLEVFESRYKKGELTEQEYRNRLDTINDR